MGKILCNTLKEKNDWDKRMLNTINGFNFPDDFDDLSENEKRKRLDNALNCLKEKEV